ncbi:hypothetical protein MMC13_001672 [Lambiella insularis]|nr:hypothetical protein [Lambiella insularis]
MALGNQEEKAESFYLSNVSFENPLSFSVFHDADSIVEVHLCARQTDKPNLFTFDIFSIPAEHDDSSLRHCFGHFGWSSAIPVEHSFPNLHINHDPFLLHRSNEHAESWVRKFTEFSIGSSGAKGTLKAAVEHQRYYRVDPRILHSVLRIPSVIAPEQNIAAVYEISSIGSFQVYASTTEVQPDHFTVETKPATASTHRNRIAISYDKSSIEISNLCVKANQLSQVPQPLRSLYFVSSLLPDISRAASLESIDILELMRLVSHKWPMCDIGTINCAPEDLAKIIDSLPGMQIGERPTFTSVRLRVVDDLDNGTKFHLLFANEELSAERLKKLLMPIGVVCIPRAQQNLECCISSGFSKICDVEGFGGVWTVLQNQPKSTSISKATIFSCLDQNLSSTLYPAVEDHIHLVPSSVEEFCKHKKERYNAIIIDSLDKSIITTWSGNSLVPWLRHFLKYADNIVWMTQERNDSPFTNVAGTLLRTIQSEQPSIKVMWLVLSEAESEATVQDAITSAYAALLSGDNEIRLEVKGSSTRILRYHPDDELSASLGLISPQMVIVQVETSVVDFDDVLAYNAQAKRSELGSFFAGRLISKACQTFPFGSKVVGLVPGAHRNLVGFSAKHLLSYDEALSPATAGTMFANLSVALAAIDGTARARQSDIVRLRVNDSLRKAVVYVCTSLQVSISENCSESIDFLVDLSASNGLQVNGTPVDVEKYLGSDRGIEKVTRLWRSRADPPEKVQSFDLANHVHAFQAAQIDPWAVALLHKNLDKATKSAVIYKKTTRLFSEDGAYIIIGGLGGLGRYVCRWMVDNGAKRIVAISRSGVKSDEAKQTYEELNALDVSFEVLKADACDRKEMSEALATIRKTSPISPIKGVMNMAMLLGDAPMADMEGWQWDIALRLKIDLSWILHEETLDDPLEFFALFSSIASVLGNRNQGGYNVGNTFLNALAEYRRSIGRTAISIALGAMSKCKIYHNPQFFHYGADHTTAEVGILHELGKQDLLQTLSRSGLHPLHKIPLAKIMEAAVVESHRSERSLIVTGLEMFHRIDGKLIGSQDQTQLYWTEVPEFGFLQHHSLSSMDAKSEVQLSIRDQLATLTGKEAPAALQEAFLGF